MPTEESDEAYYARKLGLIGSQKASGRKKLEEEFLRDGFGDDFLALFDFLDEVTPEEQTESVLPDAEEVLALANPSGKYLPPHLRAKSEGALDAKPGENLSILGMLNRVSEGNLDSISADIITKVTKDKIKPADIGCALVRISCDNPHITITLQGTFAAIACALAVETTPSPAYSGAVLAAIVNRLKEAVASSDSLQKTAGNLVRLLSTLFSFGLFGVDVIESTLSYLSSLPEEVPTEARVEWCLICVRFSGRVLKDNHPKRFTALMNGLRDKFGLMESSSSRQVEFLIKELMAMNDSKCGFRAVDHLQSACEWLISRNSNSGSKRSKVGSTLTGWRVPKSVEDVQLLGPFPNLFGGFAFPKEWVDRTMNFETQTNETVREPQAKNPEVSLEELAALNRMTSEVKKNCFIAVMGSVDAKHALLRIEQFGLLGNPKHVPAIVHVVLHCAVQEAILNSFYVQLMTKLCIPSLDTGLDKQKTRKFSVSFKIEFNRLISSGKLAPNQVEILSQLISAYLINSEGRVFMEDIINPRQRKSSDASSDS